MLISIIVICAAVLIIGVTKYKDVKKKKVNPPKQWEGNKPDDVEQTEKITEHQKGNGRGGGPFQ
ncbi:hypothetical protein [Evansella tamaricis]|uniref:Uncharacterized protein n=1 Tax=Evansella tamaricis TaxID=2069301 RepID=A0ABS6JFD9_9BACI|nr:hypothetical protein [Evansella tamaricis]MBU9712379.1 hypothetical protein [Evansella tamaricis]